MRITAAIALFCALFITPAEARRHHHHRHHHHYHHRHFAPPTQKRIRPAAPFASLAQKVNGLIAPLAAKASEITRSCGSKIISAVRRTYIAGTHLVSLHAAGKAVDLQGNPSCIYSLLHGWPGGYSTDYAQVQHVHLSYDPDGRREWGARFVHGLTHYARHHRHRRYYARAV